MRKSFLLSGALGKLGLMLFALLAVVLIRANGGWAYLAHGPGGYAENRLFYYGLFIAAFAPVAAYALYRDLTTRLTLTEGGLTASAGVGFGRLRLRRGATPVMPWQAVYFVSPMTHQVVINAEKGTYREEFSGVLIEGHGNGQTWRIELTLDMEPWGEALVFILNRVPSGSEDPALRRWLPAAVCDRLPQRLPPPPRPARRSWLSRLLGGG